MRRTGRPSQTALALVLQWVEAVRPQEELYMLRKFWVLRIISELLKVTALAALILGTLGALAAFGGQFAATVAVGIQPLGIPKVPDLLFEIVGLASFAIGFVFFLVLYGTSQLFYVLIAIEQNTRTAPSRRRASLEDPVRLEETTQLAG